MKKYHHPQNEAMDHILQLPTSLGIRTVGLGRREQYFSSMTNLTTIIIENDGYNHRIIEKTMKHKEVQKDKQ